MLTKNVIRATMVVGAFGAVLYLVSAPVAALRVNVRPAAAFSRQSFECPKTAARVSSIVGHRMIPQSRGKLFCNFAERLDTNGAARGIYVLFRSYGDNVGPAQLRAEDVRLLRASGCSIADYPALGYQAYAVRCSGSIGRNEFVVFRSPNKLHTWKTLLWWLLPLRNDPPPRVIDRQLRSLVSG